MMRSELQTSPFQGGVKNLSLNIYFSFRCLPLVNLMDMRSGSRFLPQYQRRASTKRSSTHKRGVTPETSGNPRPLGRGRGQEE